MIRMKSCLILLSIFLLIFLISCNDNESNLIESDANLLISANGMTGGGTGASSTQSDLINGNMENSTVGYWKGGTTFSGFSFSHSSQESVSPTHSISIIASNVPGNNFSYWAQTFKADNYVGKRITMTVWTKYSGVDGDGIMFVLRGDNTEVPTGSAEAFSTTQNKLDLKGTSTWKKIGVTMDPVPAGIKSLTVYMLIASQNGIVFFDDLDISAAEATPPPTNIVNGDFESGITSPDNWWMGSVSPAFKFNWDTSEFLSANHSIQISSNGSGDKFAVCAQTISASQLLEKKITLMVSLKTNSLIGEGIYVAIRGDDTSVPSGNAEVFSTTQNKQSITGTFNWKQVSVTLNHVPSNIKSLTFYLIYGLHTSGSVNFDDVSLLSE